MKKRYFDLPRPATNVLSARLFYFAPDERVVKSVSLLPDATYLAPDRGAA